MSITYDHPAHGDITAVPATPALAPNASREVDWAAVRTRDNTVLGYVTDLRWNAGDDWLPSETSSGDESALDYEAWHTDRSYIATTHSLRGALAAIGNNRSPLT